MGRRGPARTPTPELEARGSWLAAKRKKDGEPAVEVHSDVPPAPKFLTAEERKCWDRTAPLVVKMKTLADSDLDQLAQYCRRFVAWIKCEDPHLQLKMEASLRMDRRELGLTCASRSNLKAEKSTSGDDKASRFLKIAK